MKLYFVFSGDESGESTVPRAFSKSFDDAFAQRVLMHFTQDANLCTGCASFCEHCRDQYPIQFAQDIVGLLQLPAQLPLYIDDPDDFLPSELEPHDVTVAINVHEDLLLSLPDLVKRSGGQALIVPLDDTAWLNGGVRRQAERRCREIGLECAFPKPSCSLEATEDQPVIREFQRIYRVGKPKIVVQSRDGVIREARVVQSAPCGNTYFVAYNLAGQEIGPDLNERVVAKYWHSFPCVGSMGTDPELGDSILHKGGYLHYQAVDEALAEEAQLKAEALAQGKDPEEYVLMRRLTEYGEQPEIPNPLGELRLLEREAGLPAGSQPEPSMAAPQVDENKDRAEDRPGCEDADPALCA